jgi:transposase
MYAQEIRSMALVHYTRFERSLRRVAKKYGIGKSTLARWVAAMGACKPKKARSVGQKRLERLELVKAIESVVAMNPLATQASMLRELAKLNGMRLSQSSMSRMLRLSRFSRKRTRIFVTPATSQNPDTAALKRAFGNGTGNIVSVDEACFYLTDIPRYGYAKSGVRLRTRRDVPKKVRRLTLLMAISDTRVVGYEVIEGSCNSARYSAFIDGLDAPRESVILMDNAAFHPKP